MTNTRPIYSLFVNGSIIWFILLMLVEAMSWSTGSEAKLNFVKHHGGFLPYFGLLVRNTLLPEIVTVFVLATMMNATRHWFNIKLTDLTGKALISYQLRFLPTLLIAFFIFIPFIQSTRYLPIKFPAYSFNTYWDKYIIGSYSLTIYFTYLPFILLIGYSVLNVSLATNSRISRPFSFE